MIDSELYNKRISDLVDQIQNTSTIFIDNEISKAYQSNKIMKLLRGECVYVSKEYLAAANGKKYATLDPKADGVQNIISTDDLVTEWFPIFANSFGPFNPKKYFDSPIKILWLLKEPFIEKESWIKGDRGGHNQAKENRKWSQIENPTLENAIKLTRNFIKELVPNNNFYNRETEDVFQQVMNHICILEVNHFPGLGFKSKSTYDTKTGEGLLKWASLNNMLLKILIDFYEVDIVIGGYTFMGEFASNNHLLNFYATKEKGEIPFIQGEPWDYTIDQKTIDRTIFGFKIIRPWGQDDKYKRKKLSMLKTEDNRYWINAYHPLQTNNGKNKPNLIRFAKAIYQDLNHGSNR